MRGQKKSTALNGTMPPENKHLATFAEHRHIYEFYRKTGEMVGFHHHIQNQLLAAFHALYDPYYHYDRSCPACQADFLTRAYKIHDSKHTA